MRHLYDKDGNRQNFIISDSGYDLGFYGHQHLEKSVLRIAGHLENLRKGSRDLYSKKFFYNDSVYRGRMFLVWYPEEPFGDTEERDFELCDYYPSYFDSIINPNLIHPSRKDEKWGRGN